MPQYIGFSTINANQPRTSNPRVNSADYGSTSIRKPLIFGKKYRMVDAPLVIQDFINALNIKFGTKVGQPGYGTTLWDFVFEPNTQNTRDQIENELRRVASLDKRIALNYVNTYYQENGILIEVQATVVPFQEPLQISVFFNRETNLASLVQE